MKKKLLGKRMMAVLCAVMIACTSLPGAAYVFAEEVSTTSEAEPVVTEVPEATPEPTPEATPEPTPEQVQPDPEPVVTEEPASIQPEPVEENTQVQDHSADQNTVTPSASPESGSGQKEDAAVKPSAEQDQSAKEKKQENDTDSGSDKKQTAQKSAGQDKEKKEEAEKKADEEKKKEENNKEKEKEKEPEIYTVHFVDGKNIAEEKTEKVEEGKCASFPGLKKDEKYKADDGRYYYFEGWFSGNTEYTSDSKITGNITLRARWTEAVKVTFEARQTNIAGILTDDSGAAVSTMDRYVKKGESVTKPGDPTTEGYLFENWYTEPARRNVYAFNQSSGKAFATADSDITLYARYVKLINVSFDSNGAENGPGAVEVREDKRMEQPADPDRHGYQVAAWYILDENGSRKAKMNFSETLKNQGITEDVTLQAEWEPITFTVIYESALDETVQKQGLNGVKTSGVIKYVGDAITETDVNVEFDDEEGYTISAEDPSRTGYTFLGWQIDGEGTYYKNGSTISSELLPAADGSTLSLVAAWEANQYNIHFKANVPEGKEAENENAVEDQTMTYDEEAALTSEEFALKDGGYVFAGWNSSADASTAEYHGGDLVKNLSDKDDVDLFGVWEDTIAPEITYNVFKVDGNEDESEFLIGAVNQTIEYEFHVKETGSGIASIGYSIGTDSYDQSIAPAETAEGEDGVYRFTIEAPAGGTVYVKVTDKDGNEGVAEAKSIVVENTAPTLSVTPDAVEEGVYVQNYSFEATAEDGGSIYSGIRRLSWEVRKEGSDAVLDKYSGEIYSAEDPETNPDSMEEVENYKKLEESVEIAGTDLNGIYQITFKAVDFCGNEAEPVSYTLYLDNTKPDIEIDVTGTNEKGSYGKDIEIKIEVQNTDTETEEKSDLKSISVKVNGTEIKTQNDFESETQGGTITLKWDDLESFTTGDEITNFEIEVTAEDKAGNESGAKRKIELDYDAPIISVTMDGIADEARAYHHNADNSNITVSIQDEISDIADGFVVKVTDPSGEAVFEKTGSAIKSNSTEVTISNASEWTADGTYTLSVTDVKDVFDNEAGPDEFSTNDTIQKVDGTTTATFVFDHTKPVITLAMSEGNHISGSWYYREENSDLSYAVSDNAEGQSGLVSYKFTVNDEDLTKDVSNSVEETIKLSKKFENAENQTIKVTLEATDAAGNKADLKTGTVKGMKLDDTTASIILDMVSPVLTSLRGTENTGSKLYDDHFYYYNTKDVTLAYRLDDKNPYYVALSNSNQDKQERQDSKLSGSFDMNEEGIYDEFVISGADKAGNPLEVDAGYSYSPEDEIDTGAVSGGSKNEMAEEITLITKNIPLKYGKVIDKTAPKATITHSSGATAFIYKDNGLTGYFNKDITTEIKVTDQNKLDQSKIYRKQIVNSNSSTKGDKLSDEDKNGARGSEITDTFKAAKDGDYHYVVYGTDRAGNAMEVTESLTSKKDVKSGEDQKAFETKEAKGSYASAYILVRDTKAPEFTSSFNEISGNETVDGKTAYYGSKTKTLKASFTVKDAHIDKDRLAAAISSVESKKYNSKAKPAWVRLEENGDNCKSGNSTSAVYQLSAGTEGVHRFEIFGVDKAGNALKQASEEGGKSDYNRTTSGSQKGSFWSEKKVLDKTAPEATYTIGNYYKVVLKKSGNDFDAKIFDPFRAEKSAAVKVKADDHSPVYVVYDINAVKSNGAKSKTTVGKKNYKNDQEQSKTVKAQAQFEVRNIKVMDRAGNKVTLKESNTIYLDNTKPKGDLTAPTATIQATSAVTHRSADGRNLYNHAVSLKVNVVDPNAKQSSSGLNVVHYVARADGKIIKEADLFTSKAKSVKKLGEDAKLQYEFSTTIPIESGGAFETNGIEVILTAKDNAGNESNPELGGKQKLGIDTKGPEIVITYDNNSAQNGKYFKDPRTATVTVTDRNVDNNKISIRTEVGVPGAFSYASGGGNGANDKWTKQLNYSSDGNYTLNVSGTDALGNPGTVRYEGTAPQDFVIDRTAPVITVTFDNNDVQNLKYYKDPRTATISINEHNFNGSEVKINPNAVGPRNTPLAWPGNSGFGNSGDVHNASINFNEDGTYSFDVNYTDLAGNPAQIVVVDEFVVDQTKPKVKIEGVANNHAYGDTVSPVAVYEDDNLSRDLLEFSFTGTRIRDRKDMVPAYHAIDDYNGEYRIGNIRVEKRFDDIYRAYAKITDLAGNEAETDINFSVNRFGSAFDYNKDTVTENLVETYYTNAEKSVILREVNINKLESYTATLYRDGENRALEENKDFTVKESRYGEGGYQYVYTFADTLFSQEGNYDIVVQSKDTAGNQSTNTSIREDEGTSEVPLRFAIDKTVPTYSIAGIDTTKRINRVNADELKVDITPADNMMLSEMVLMIDNVVQQTWSQKELLEEMDANGGKLEYTIGSRTKPQELQMVIKDAAGNELSSETYSVHVTQNAIARYYYNRPLFFSTLAAAAALIFLIIWSRRRRSRRQAQRRAAK